MKNRKPSKSNRIPILIFLTVVCVFVWFGNKNSNDNTTAAVESSSTLRSLSSTSSSSSSTSPPPTSKEATTTPDYEDYALARNHTYGFLNDIPTKEWKRIQRNVKAMQPNECPNCPGGKYTNAWFQNNYEPEISCRHEQRIGRLGDGGKWVCDPHRISENPDCLVYSVGSNNDFSFEEHVFASIGSHCEIHTFDPADYSAQAERVRNQMKTLSSKNMNLHYHQWGIAGENQGDQYLTVNETVHRLGHVGRTIDIFKIDCEGCELSSFNTWVGLHEDTIRLMQVLVEVHARKDHIQRGVEEFFEGMHKHGYAIFHKEPNIHYWTSGPVAAVEYGYFKLAPEFFA